MPGEFCLPRVIERQRVRERRHPVANLQGEMRRGRANHLRKLGRVRNRIDVFAAGPDRDRATAGHGGGRR